MGSYWDDDGEPRKGKNGTMVTTILSEKSRTGYERHAPEITRKKDEYINMLGMDNLKSIAIEIAQDKKINATDSSLRLAAQDAVHSVAAHDVIHGEKHRSDDQELLSAVRDKMEEMVEGLKNQDPRMTGRNTVTPRGRG